MSEEVKQHLSAPFVFGRKKWLEQMLLHFLTHPNNVVGDADANVVAWLQFFGAHLALLGWVDCERSRFQREAAAVSHRIACIYHQVQDDVRELAGIHFGVQAFFVAVEMALHRNIFAQETQ